MKKKTMIIFILIVCGLLSVMIYNNLHLRENNHKTVMQFTDETESKLLDSIDKMPDKESYSISYLLKALDWVEITPPENFNQWKKLEERFDSWRVDRDNELKVSVNRSQVIDGYNFNKLTVRDGFFMSVYTGEWSGALYFYPNGNKNEKYKIKDGYIWSVYEHNNVNYALQAFPFAQSSGGKILRLEKHFGRWKAKEITDIGDVPYCFTYADDKTMYMVTYNKLLKLVDNRVTEVVIDNAFWKGLYPNSAVYDDGYIYIGMRAGVAKVDLSSKKVIFFTPVTELLN